jgi:hypothetical protein
VKPVLRTFLSIILLACAAMQAFAADAPSTPESLMQAGHYKQTGKTWPQTGAIVEVQTAVKMDPQLKSAKSDLKHLQS